MRAGIAIDDWKLPIFKAALTKAGYVFEQGSLTDSMLLLFVETQDGMALAEVVQAANDEAARSRMN